MINCYLTDEKGSLLLVRNWAMNPSEEESDLEAFVSISKDYNKIFDFWEELDKKKAVETISILEEAVESLGTKKDKKNSMKGTLGNVGYGCSILLSWAMQHPEGIWNIDVNKEEIAKEYWKLHNKKEIKELYIEDLKGSINSAIIEIEEINKRMVELEKELGEDFDKDKL